jgi:hypothetical protein
MALSRKTIYRKTIYNGSVGPLDAVYHLISATFSDSADLWITGRIL